MMKIRKMLTEVLLEVTGSELESIAKEVVTKAQAKALKGSCHCATWVHPVHFICCVLNSHTYFPLNIKCDTDIFFVFMTAINAVNEIKLMKTKFFPFYFEMLRKTVLRS